MIDRQHLAIVREVRRLGSVTAAAERLNLTQSALSHTIRKFEERHRVQVWTRQGRGLRFTQAGERLLELAERVLPQLEDAERMLEQAAAGRRGTLRVGMECHPCQKWLMRVTGPFLAAWPDVDLEVRTAFRFDGVTALAGYDIDLLITPDPARRPDLRYVPVFDYELVLVVHSEHPLGGRQSVDPADLQDEDLVTVPVSVDRLDVYTRFLLPAGVRPRRQRTAETTELMLQIVAARRAVSVVPDWLVQEYGAGLPIRVVRLGARGLAKSIHIGMRAEEPETAYVDGFLRLAREHSPEA
ncbi:MULTISPECIES: LysR family transcriptional regulator [unclassified Rubrivivax]|uniref:LysR family transcriptional regulator n=1 Tax=unclassified Rubrivivax TaxID=2649762 RepID=UPI001E39D1D4|nr:MULTISPECIES: LysR family transcriptional regulator [unclassified Rubrivivax]MCC9597969.1 LysR family transcriptional regulator [Rubrivivax sp. JA1055]MCC9645774.1 LysR family transcriptional regulator [Rubrivivax sp. JA1029]